MANIDLDKHRGEALLTQSETADVETLERIAMAQTPKGGLMDGSLQPCKNVQS